MEPITLQSAAIFLGGILLTWLANKYGPKPPAVPPVGPAPVPVPSPGPGPIVPAPLPQLGDGHILKELLAALILALQQSTPVKVLPNPPFQPPIVPPS